MRWARWMDGEREIRKSSSFLWLSLRKLPVIQKEHYSGSFHSGFFRLHVCRLLNYFAGLWNLYITDTLSSSFYYLHIFPLRIIIAFYHHCTYVLQAWAHWSDHLFENDSDGQHVCPISNKQDEVGKISITSFIDSLKNHLPLFLHSANETLWCFSVLLRNELMLNVETSGCWIVICLFLDYLSKHVHITHFLTQFHCLQNEIYKML